MRVAHECLELLDQHAETLDAFLRKTIVQSLIFLQNRDLLSRLELLPVLFRLFRCADKGAYDASRFMRLKSAAVRCGTSAFYLCLCLS